MAEEPNTVQYKTSRGVLDVSRSGGKCDLCGCGGKVWLHWSSSGKYIKRSEQPTSEQLGPDRVWHGSAVYHFGSAGTFCVFCRFPETMPKIDLQMKLF